MASQEALTTNGIGESPLMDWIEWLAGVENGLFGLCVETGRQVLEVMMEPYMH